MQLNYAKCTIEIILVKCKRSLSIDVLGSATTLSNKSRALPPKGPFSESPLVNSLRLLVKQGFSLSTFNLKPLIKLPSQLSLSLLQSEECEEVERDGLKKCDFEILN